MKIPLLFSIFCDQLLNLYCIMLLVNRLVFQDPAAIQAIAENMDKSVKNDKTEATVNRKLWNEVFENDIILTLPQAESLLSESSTFFIQIHK